MAFKNAWHQQRVIVPPHLRTSRDGIVFPSRTHMIRYTELMLEQRHGFIKDIQIEPRFPLYCGDSPILTPTGRTARYTADFAYMRLIDGEWVRVIEDHKGFMDKLAEFRIAVFEACYGVKVYIHR